MLGGPRALSQFKEYEWNDPVIRAAGGLPWDSGVLDWEKLPTQRPLDGAIVVPEGYSRLYKGDFIGDALSVEAHDLGHILLNDGSHRYTTDNIMGGEVRSRLDSDMCEMIRYY